MDFKNIHMGSLVKKRSDELAIPPERLAKFMDCQVKDLPDMYKAETLDSGVLLRWCKILEYDFFRMYSQHLILYAPASIASTKANSKITADMPQFRKNIYSMELIDYMLELIKTGKKTRTQILKEYGIPRTTLYKWITKDNDMNK